MKQLFQDVKTGAIVLTELPIPECKEGYLLIRTQLSLISSGTERSLLEFGNANYLQKARDQPERVRDVYTKIKTDGFVSTLDAVKAKLEQPMPMGYSNVGVVEKVGSGVDGFRIGDRVISNGPHAEVVCVPKNLVCRVPNSVPDRSAVFTVVGSVALQGIRLTAPTLGECIVVVGLGLIGLLTVQILKANGCRVLGIDYDSEKLDLASKYGAETLMVGSNDDPIVISQKFSRGRGVDAVIITASTGSNEPVHQAATMCRRGGRIVLVGVVGLDLKRSDFYEKEISFRVSCSYGPGRYDAAYEEQGNDYPVGYVRWTENRNFEAVLDMLSEEFLDIALLTTSQFTFDDCSNAYDLLISDKKALGILLTYPLIQNVENRTLVLQTGRKTVPDKTDRAVIGLIGAGNHASRALLPALNATGAKLKTISSSQGITGSYSGRKFGFSKSTTDNEAVFDDEELNTVVIATRHNTHAELVVSALRSGKSVYVEKPLAVTEQDLRLIELAHSEANMRKGGSRVMVGFNRRFSPLAVRLKAALAATEPLSIVYVCNAGKVSDDSWVHDPVEGGGRVIGEACHFIDMCRFLAGSPIKSIDALSMDEKKMSSIQPDTVSLTIKFESGSLASVHYFANGNRGYPKERVDVFQSGRVATLYNYMRLKGHGFKGLRNKKLMRQDKGVRTCVRDFINSVEQGLESPIPFEESLEVSRYSIAAAKQIIDGYVS